MPTKEQTLNISSAIANIRSAERILDTIVSSTGEPDILANVTAIYQQVNQVLNLLVQTQTAADDMVFEAAAAALKEQNALLKAQEAKITRVIADIGVAAQVVGYIAQAVAFIAVL